MRLEARPAWVPPPSAGGPAPGLQRRRAARGIGQPDQRRRDGDVAPGSFTARWAAAAAQRQDLQTGPRTTRRGRRMPMSDAAGIRALVGRWANAVHAGDMGGVRAGHADDIVVFDVPPPDDGVRGTEAYRATWPPFFEWQRQGAAFGVVSLEVTAGAEVAFAHALLRCGRPRSSAGTRTTAFGWPSGCASRAAAGSSRTSTTRSRTRAAPSQQPLRGPASVGRRPTPAARSWMQHSPVTPNSRPAPTPSPGAAPERRRSPAAGAPGQAWSPVSQPCRELPPTCRSPRRPDRRRP
jgi:ketosteroid isomerase-like protein